MEKGSLKLKLKIGSTPDSPAMDVGSFTSKSDSDPDIEEEFPAEEGMLVQSQELSMSLGDEPVREKHKKSKKKKKKKEREKEKHRHKRTRIFQDSFDEGELALKRLCGDDARLPERVASPETVAVAFKELLFLLLRELEKRDINEFFADPVTDSIAPGYSSIISEPMCFATIREKIQRGSYTSLLEFEDDAKLIATNCMKYNRSDTVYFSAGKRMLSDVKNALCRERLLALKKDFPSIVFIPREILGVSLVESIRTPFETASDDVVDSPNTDSRSEGDDDDEDSEEEAAAVIRQATEAARRAALALHRNKPTSTMGYVSPRKDGTLGLKFLSGCEGTQPSTVRMDGKPITMGMIIGKILHGSSSLHNYHDDKRTMAKPVKPINYGAFSSFCPSYDSTFSNLSKDESDLVRATYGNETAVQYAESICEFSKDCTMATTLVDQLLNLLTSGQHSRTRNTITSRHQAQQRLEQQRQSDEKKDVKPIIEGVSASSIQELRSLSELGIDVSFLDSFERAETTGTLSCQLAQTGQLVQGLAAEQGERLSKQSSTAPLAPSIPTQGEIKMADRLTSELVSVARQLPPSAILPSSTHPTS